MTHFPSQQMHALHISDNARQAHIMTLADEVAIALSYNGTTHAVMMATPSDLHDFAIGFSLTEGLISSIDEIEEITQVDVEAGIDIQIRLNEGKRQAFQTRRRHMAGPVGCGLCGIESIEAAMRILPEIGSALRITAGDIAAAFAALGANQHLNSATRCAHAAAFYRPGCGLMTIREDIGRHNALDKLIGSLLRERNAINQGFIIVTSRLSVEMVQKAALAGAPILVAVSSATAEAVRNGMKANMTLVARARGKQFDIYTNPQRIIVSTTLKTQRVEHEKNER